MKKTLLIVSLILSLLLSSCEETIHYTSRINTFAQADLVLCETQQCPLIDLNIISIQEPVVLSEPINIWVKKKSLDLLDQKDFSSPVTYEDAIAHYINESQISYPETVVLSDAHELTIDTSISYSSNDVLSILFFGYKFSGGAHGFDYEIYGNFNPQTGERYTNEALLNEDFYAFAKAQLSSAYPNRKFSTQSQNYREIGFSEEGLIIIYNDLGADAIQTDNAQLVIPWEDAENYLNL